MFRVPEQYRIQDQIIRADASHGNRGAFFIPRQQTKKGRYFLCIASEAQGWEHVSVSIPAEKRNPTWDEMCYIKSLFWEEEDAVVQLHPPKSQNVNLAPYCLHLWRPSGEASTYPDPGPRLWTVFDLGMPLSSLYQTLHSK